ncbi:MAG: GxxExxY protein [Myxococcota bacterium]|nr:GxxExxY protein [Myxococcota bacterium]
MQAFYDLPEHLNEYSHRVIGAAIEVHRHLGPGFLEKTYEEALVVELGLRNIKVQRQLSIPITYKDQLIHSCCLDLLVEDELVVEVKAVEQILRVHRAQVHSYLRAGPFQLGLVINFNVHSLRDGIARVIDTMI